MRSAGLALTGGTAAIGLSGAVPESASAAAAGAQGTSARVMSVVRRRSYGQVVEAVAGLRGTAPGAGALGEAQTRLAQWYAEAGVVERLEMDDALDAVTAALSGAAPGAPDVKEGLAKLAVQLDGPKSRQLTTAIGLAVSGLGSRRAKPGDALAVGQLHARMIRALRVQDGPGRLPRPAITSNQTAPCPTPTD